MALAVTESQVQELLSKASFTKLYHLRVKSLGDGECTLAVPFLAEFQRPGGLVSGPVYMAAADMAMWVAIMTRVGNADAIVTVELNTKFVSAARQEDIFCSAKILKMGRQLIFGTAECVNGEGKLLTHHTITYFRTEHLIKK
jgi:uncharacterized protein (TIGR00369 family)